MKVIYYPGGGSGTGSCEFDIEDPVPTTHGGLTAGTHINGLTPCDVLQMILYPYQSPAFTSFYIEGQTATLEVGDKVTGGERNFIWSTINDQNIIPNTISIKDITAGIDLITNTANDGYETIDIGNDKILTTPGTYTWRIIGINTKNQQFSRDFSVRWYYRVYWGASENDTLTEDQVKALSNSALKQNYSGNYSFTTDGTPVYYFIVYPDSWGEISSWVDSDTNFAVDYQYVGTVDITNDYGVTTTYKLLRTTYKQTQSLNSIVS
jgi:hypothetical protein